MDGVAVGGILPQLAHERTHHPGGELIHLVVVVAEKREAAFGLIIRHQSRGVAITAGDDPELKPFVAQGRDLFMRREGQLNLACTNCHDDNFDKRLAGAPITQGQPTGYPLYRLEWQTLGSIERRLRSCMTGVRAQAYDYGAPELVALELYLMSRARGLPMETPAVRP